MLSEESQVALACRNVIMCAYTSIFRVGREACVFPTACFPASGAPGTNAVACICAGPEIAGPLILAGSSQRQLRAIILVNVSFLVPRNRPSPD